MTVTPTLTLITPVGRPEYDYLHQSARVLPLLDRLIRKRVDQHGGLEWVLAVDDPAVSAQDVMQAVTFPGRDFPVWVMPSTGDRQGSGLTRNRALEYAAGTWMMALDSDDVLLPYGVLGVLETLTNHDVAWAAARGFDILPDLSPDPDNDRYVDIYPPGVIPSGSFWEYLQAHEVSPFVIGSVMASTMEVYRIGGWPAMFDREDSGMLAVLNSMQEGLWIPRYVMNYRKHPSAKTADKRRRGRIPLDHIRAMVDAGYTHPEQVPA